MDFSFLDDLDCEFGTDTNVDIDFANDFQVDWMINELTGNSPDLVDSFSGQIHAPEQPQPPPSPPKQQQTRKDEFTVPAFLKDTAGVRPVPKRPMPRKRKISSVAGCTCKSTKCLKKYCVCFAQGKKCDPNVCSCKDCENNEDRVVKPRALQGCTCRRSKCLKKYCDCFAAGSKCDPAKCSCKDCENTITAHAAPAMAHIATV